MGHEPVNKTPADNILLCKQKQFGQIIEVLLSGTMIPLFALLNKVFV